MNGLLLTDGYKTGHHQQYPKGTGFVIGLLAISNHKKI
ncbi:nicotinamide phosphoribosyltransferase domain-containing protein [Tenacibaculum finnmarkense]|nr:nicotinamide phosphoribosyltransferase domain-containing protein [Tenacibaculum finnmarkense]MBE7697168.1 hypothetical protein [Tenacibaculum finnmarkense genomovar ulcerans]MCD8439366.1 nicotinamide phosphoribosyltransferase domain-containing protein [Tenacibaculum finnmarkense genomovar ulcerans]MCG8720215.1 hypothetical protein [Tenacibaculum finnmarkense]WCC46568.1 nicotinamide phosphoribosyltransferase domain-containing protein [Tenacibaculum finnmarkense]